MTFIFGKILGFLTGNIAQYLLIGGAVLSVYAYHNYSIKSAAKQEVRLEITEKTQKVQNDRIKKARRARHRVNSKRMRKGRDPYRRD